MGNPRKDNEESPQLLREVRDKVAFQTLIRHLSNSKQGGPDGVPNEVIKILPESLTSAIHDLITLMWIKHETPDSWKESNTFLLHKPNKDPTNPNSYRPIGLANTILKLWTATLARVISQHAEQHSMLSSSQEGFRKAKNTHRQLMNVILAIEDATITKQNLYSLYIDFSSAFNTTDHDKQLRIMHATGYPEDAIKAVRSVYTNTTTTILTPHGKTDPIKVERGTIQGDNLSPLLFLIYIEPLLRWLHSGGRGYQYGCLTKELNLQYNLSAPAFADDLDILVNNVRDLHIQVSKVNSFNQWAGLDANADKSTATAILHKDYEVGLIPKNSSPCDGPRIRNQLEGKILLGGKAVPYLPPDEPYKYLGVWLTLTLNWTYQHNKTMKDIKIKGEAVLASMASTKQKLKMISQVIKPGVTYDFPLAFYNPRDISKMDNKIASLARKACWLPSSSPTIGILAAQEQGGLGVTSLWIDYVQLSTSMIIKALNDEGRLGTVTRALLNLQNIATGALIMDMSPQHTKYLTPLRMI